MLTPALKISILLAEKAFKSVGSAPCVRDTPLMVPELTLPVRGTARGVSKAWVKVIYSVPEMPAESVMFVMLIPTRRDKFGMIGATKLCFSYGIPGEETLPTIKVDANRRVSKIGSI